MGARRTPDELLRSVLWTVSDFLSDLVVVGGWVPYLHRHYGSYLEWRSDPVFTEELDLLVHPPLRRSEGRTMADALRERGLRPVGEGTVAAVWASETDPGERIEFFVEHVCPGATLASVHRVEEGGGVGALSLRGLWLLRDHSTKLSVPLGRYRGKIRTAEVTVPDLGAFVVQKAASFPRRPEGVKQAKDLFYLFEIMAAGETVQSEVERMVAEISAESGAAAQEVRTACHNVESVLREEGALRQLLEPTAEMVSERYGIEMAAARARLEGYLRDFFEILGPATSEP